MLRARLRHSPRLSRQHGNRLFSTSTSETDSPRLIVGLGNPGPEYANTRHNVGFKFVDELARKYNLSVQHQKFDSLYGVGTINGMKVFLVKPLTYMNRSGQSVRRWIDYYKIPISNTLIVYDAADLPLGALRIRGDGKAGGQKGLQNIIDVLSSNKIPRLKIGIGAPPSGMDLADYVLSTWRPNESLLIENCFQSAIECTETWMRDGLEKAMNNYNGLLKMATKQNRG